MRVLLVSVLAAALTATVASAGTPDGFWKSARLSAPAAFVAGKPVTAYCAYTAGALQALASSSEQPPDLQGLAFTGGDVVYLSPLTCAYLNAWANGKRVKNLYGVAGSLLTIAHEAEHAKGVKDETDADCAALRALPALVKRYFPLRGRETLHDLMFDATRGHQTKAPEYQTHPC